MRLTVVGSGDAFGSGGRLQTSYHVARREGDFLIDCGATTLIGMQRLGLDPDRVSTIFISHLHGDHFAGLVWWLLHAHYVTGRTVPLTVIGPPGIAERFAAAAEALFPNSTQIERRFEMTFRAYAEPFPMDVDGVRVTPFEVLHPSGAPPYALRFECDGKVLSFSGDTRWVENLVPAAHGADLFISECFSFAAPEGYHMSWRDIERNIDRLDARRLLLTHMGPEMLAHRDLVTDPRILLAEDGMHIDV
ncbi:MAG: MBL fold metallo-hydrolase [Hyphomicrobium sp.]|jgi:ribonuclease BN (tRNA processing enzyme)